MKTKEYIYLDYAASTPLDQRVYDAMRPYLEGIVANPSSIHSLGQKAHAAIDQARKAVAKSIGAQSNEIVFTSGATEANNLCIQGLVNAGDHIVTTAIEHVAVLDVCKALEQRGVQVAYIRPNQEGCVAIHDVVNAIKPNTRLVSLMSVNNEIGTIQPIKEIAQELREINKTRDNSHQIIFHTDAAQAFFVPQFVIEDIGIDCMTLSGHKMYGPQGVGVLYKKSHISVSPQFFGGSQEFGLRPGTPSVASIVGCGTACVLRQDFLREYQRVAQLRDALESALIEIIPDCIINGQNTVRTAHHVHISQPCMDAQTLLIKLDQQGIMASAGAACSAGAVGTSHVVEAIQKNPQYVQGSIRLSLGLLTTEKDIKKTIVAFKNIFSV